MISPKNIVYNFLFGGTIFVIIYYVANKLKNAEMSAAISLIPISLICCYIIYDITILKKHTLNLVPTILITVVITLILYFLLQNNVNNILAITISLLLWILLVYLRIRFLPIN